MGGGEGQGLELPPRTQFWLRHWTPRIVDSQDFQFIAADDQVESTDMLEVGINGQLYPGTMLAVCESVI